MSRFAPIIPRSIPPEKAICGFTTRNGGVSSAPFESLNCGFSTHDDRIHVLENHNIVYRYAGVRADDVALMGQVHGSVVRIANTGGIFEKTDGLVTGKNCLMLGIQVADCIPLLLYDPVHTVIGAIHCGWRPIVAGIAERSLKIMGEHFGTAPETVIATMGPSAGPCCYRIGGDVARQLNSGSIINRNGNMFADLRAELSHRLINTGLKKNNLEIFDDCTICNESLYYSYRRDGLHSGRMLGFIMLSG